MTTVFRRESNVAMGRPWVLGVVFCSSLLFGCFLRYATVAEVPAGQSALLQNIENYYLAKAKEQAAFMGRCSLEGITTLVISSRSDSVLVSNRDKTFFMLDNGREIVNIGTQGCGQRMIFQVICGPNQYYGAVAMPPYGKGCDVVAGAAASHLILRNDELHRRQQEEAASQ